MFQSLLNDQPGLNYRVFKLTKSQSQIYLIALSDLPLPEEKI